MKTLNTLIVEDDYTVAMYLKDLLLKAGYTVSGIVSKGIDAIGFVRENTVDIVLMDVELEGDMDGVETVKEIYKIANPYIIYITALQDKKTFTRAKATFPKFFLSKPFNEFQLIDVIDQILNSEATNLNKSSKKGHFLAKKSGKDAYKQYATNSIKYIKVENSYTDIFFKNDSPPITLIKSLTKTLNKLNAEKLIRIHRKYAINMDEIDTIDKGGHIKLINCDEVFIVQEAYKAAFNKAINKL